MMRSTPLLTSVTNDRVVSENGTASNADLRTNACVKSSCKRYKQMAGVKSQLKKQFNIRPIQRSS